MAGGMVDSREQAEEEPGPKGSPAGLVEPASAIDQESVSVPLASILSGRVHEAARDIRIHC